MPLDTVRLRDEIRKVYSEVARDPKKVKGAQTRVHAAAW
jgi:hypothetical protein